MYLEKSLFKDWRMPMIKDFLKKKTVLGLEYGSFINP